MTIRYVHQRKGSKVGAFDDPDKPARTIADALKACAPGDVVEIQDAAKYVEPELVIDKPLRITSAHLKAHPDLDPTKVGFDGKGLPTITPNGPHRVIRISGGAGDRAAFGPVVVQGVRVTGGLAVHTAADPGLGCGGGIVVVDADNVVIRQCVITGNRTRAQPQAAWPEPDRLALRSAVLDLAAEIFSPSTEAALNAVIDRANKLRALLGPAKPPLARVSRAAVLAELGKAFDARLSPGRPNSALGGQAFGGGVAFVWSSGELRNCLLRGNVAEGRGAGVAVSGYGWPTIDHCWIDGNSSGAAGRRDGGGIGCTVSFPGRLPRDLSEVDLVRFLTGKLRGLRSVVADPLAGMSISDLVDAGSWLLDPDSTRRGIWPVISRLVHGAGDEAADLLFYFLLSTALGRHKWEAWKQDEIERARHSAITVGNCRVSGNVADDDGGGLYASVMSRVDLRGTSFTGNLARGSGGGARLSMGSGATITDCEFTGNTAVVDVRRDPLRKVVNGGGAISCRNVDLQLRSTRVGPRPGAGIDKRSNVTTDHAGGGLAYQADTEGALAGIPDLWTAIQREVFGVAQVKVTIDRGSSVVCNGAGYDEGRRPLRATDKAKGGGAWFVQGAFPDAPKLALTIAAFRATFRDNVAQTRKYASKLQPAFLIAAADEVCVQDIPRKSEWTETNPGPLVKPSGDLVFQG